MKAKKINIISSLILLISASIILSSCSKNDKDGKAHQEVFLTCKLNGKEVKFNHHVNANSKPAEKEVHFVVVAGFETEDILSNSFGIDMVIPGEGAKVGTYSVAGGSTPELDGEYCVQIFKDGKQVDTDCYSGGRGEGTNFTLNITSLDSWGVKGTFSGKLDSYDGKTIIIVTDGKFSAPYNGG